jgi:hypothetical protein
MITVQFRERHGRATAIVDVDEDSFLVVCDFRYPDYKAPVRTTSDLYSDVLGVRREHRFLKVGTVLFTISPDDRLAAVEWRVGPATLSRGRLDPISEAIPVEIKFEANWSDDDRLSVDALTSSTYCPDNAILRVSFGAAPTVWGAVADRVKVGVTSSYELAGLQIEAMPVDLLRLVQGV